jgi:agmatine/peptidylarginine deiminase
VAEKPYGEAAAVDSLPLPPRANWARSTSRLIHEFHLCQGSLIFPCYDPEKDAVAQQYSNVFIRIGKSLVLTAVP